MEPTYYTAKQTAEIAERSVSTIKRAAREGRLKFSQARGPLSPYRFKREWIEEWLKPQTDEPAVLEQDVAEIIGGAG